MSVFRPLLHCMLEHVMEPKTKIKSVNCFLSSFHTLRKIIFVHLILHLTQK